MMSLVTGYKYTTNQQMKAIIYKRNTGNQNKMDDTKTYTGPIHYKSTNESDYIKKKIKEIEMKFQTIHKNGHFCSLKK